jgi:hypothetical protein
MEELGRRSFYTDRRSYPRFELSQALAYQWGLTKGTLRTVDVSLGGVRIQTERPIPVDGRLDLIILFQNEAIKPTGKVVRSVPSSNRKYDVGIYFEGISHCSLERLDRFLKGTTLREKLAKRNRALSQPGLEGLNLESFESDRLRANFLGWLHKSYPVDYQRYAHQSRMSENEIRAFLKRKGIDDLNIHYLMKSLGA